MRRYKSYSTKIRLRIEFLEKRWVPTTITPTTFDDGGLGSGSLRDAVLQFNADTGTNDDIIQLSPGTYTLSIPNTSWHQSGGLDGDLYLTQTSHRWIIQGTGLSTIIDASQLQDRVFQIVNPGTQVVFQDLVIQGGLAQDDGAPGARPGTTDALGGGIFNNGGDVTLDNVVVQNNVARGADAAVLSAPGHSASGGGVYSTGGALTTAGATIRNNQVIGGRGGDHNGLNLPGNGGAATGAGLYATGGALDISSSMIASNHATGGRSGDGFSTMQCTSSRCHTYYYGGFGGAGQGSGLYVSGGSLTLATSTMTSNQATGGPAGLYGYGGFGGGGGLANLGMLTISDSTLSGNTTSGDGGGIYNFSGTLTVSNSTLSGNGNYPATILGGGIYNYSGTLTVSNSTLSGNTASAGGGIYNVVGTLMVSDSTLSGNSARFGDGGGIYNSGTLTVSYSTLSGNTGDYGRGGGIYNYMGTLTVSNSTLSGNHNLQGGGITNSGTLTVSNSTLSGNSTNGFGGGILTEALSSPITLTNVTLTDNRANGIGGGLAVGSSSPVLHNTLSAGNFRGATGTTRDDVYGSLDPSGDYNLVGDGTNMTGLSNGVNGNLVGSADSPIDPLLGPLADNRGPTLTHALLPGSPALNAGNPNQLGVPDQRGVVRSSGVNIGAYQASASAFIVTAPDTVQSGAPFDVTVMAVDPFGQVAVGYTGTVTFSTSDLDPGVVLPADYTFTAADGGVHTFTDTGLGEITLVTPGDQTLTVADTTDGTINGNATITVMGGNVVRTQDRFWTDLAPSLVSAERRR
jgi:hypothetical protein